MQLINDAGNGEVICKEVDLKNIKAATSPLAQKILKLLADNPSGLHSSRIAKELKEHEQKIYYHTRQLVKAGILAMHHTEESYGGLAKVLVLKTPAFAVRLRPFDPLARIAVYTPSHIKFLAPFIENGRLQAQIVVGSPDPHGPEQARSRDANYAIDLALFLGTYLATRASPAVQLDTELRNWNQHFIIIGGPVVNKAAEKINTKSAIPYDRDVKAFVHKGKTYGHDEIGIIVKMPNPFARNKWILHIAGKRHIGTRAAILAFLTQFDLIAAKTPDEEGAVVCVVEGLDADSDGVIEEVKILN